MDENAKPISQIVCSLLDGVPTVLFVYTARNHKNCGFAERLIKHAAFALGGLGYREMTLYVSAGYPAEKLYRRLGFVTRQPLVQDSLHVD